MLHREGYAGGIWGAHADELLALKWTMISIFLFSVAEKLNFSLSSLPSLKFFGGLLLVLHCLQNQSNSLILPDFYFLLLT